VAAVEAIDRTRRNVRAVIKGQGTGDRGQCRLNRRRKRIRRCRPHCFVAGRYRPISLFSICSKPWRSVIGPGTCDWYLKGNIIGITGRTQDHNDRTHRPHSRIQRNRGAGGANIESPASMVKTSRAGSECCWTFDFELRPRNLFTRNRRRRSTSRPHLDRHHTFENYAEARRACS